MRIIEDKSLETLELDWSGCRSPARAMRRFKKRGIEGKMRRYYKPMQHAYVIGDSVIMHPVLAAELRRVVPEVERASVSVLDNPAMSFSFMLKPDATYVNSTVP